MTQEQLAQWHRDNDLFGCLSPADSMIFFLIIGLIIAYIIVYGNRRC